MNHKFITCLLHKQAMVLFVEDLGQILLEIEEMPGKERIKSDFKGGTNSQWKRLRTNQLTLNVTDKRKAFAAVSCL